MRNGDAERTRAIVEVELQLSRPCVALAATGCASLRDWETIAQSLRIFAFARNHLLSAPGDGKTCYRAALAHEPAVNVLERYHHFPIVNLCCRQRSPSATFVARTDASAHITERRLPTSCLFFG